MKKIEVLGLQSVPEIKQGDNLAEIIVKCADNEIGGLQEKDIVVLTSKIVSKALGLTRKKTDVKVSKKALKISKKTGKDPVWVQMIFDAGHKILAIMPLKGIVEQHIDEFDRRYGNLQRACRARAGPLHNPRQRRPNSYLRCRHRRLEPSAGCSQLFAGRPGPEQRKKYENKFNNSAAGRWR